MFIRSCYIIITIIIQVIRENNSIRNYNKFLSLAANEK